ncbi:MAG: efflux RND transporter periplasmic adaptor subunit [Wenzhouxiangellaceae bacterium]
MNAMRNVRGRPGRYVSAVILVLAVAACGGADDGQQPPPPPVSVDRFEPTEVTVSREYAGRARGSREVEVRARVEGILLERLYTEGQVVESGAELFLIDPEPYQIALQQAEAERANARARHAQAEREWRQVASLFEQGAISERDRDRARSELELAEAGLALAEAGVAAAHLNLQWTRVSAPIAGATGLETLSEGSLISQGTLLTTLTQTDPVHVRFALPEHDAAMQQAVRRARSGNGEDHQRSATLILPDGSTHDSPGVVDFTDASIDARTGSVSARAVFPNPDGIVMPGQFVRLRLVTQQLDDVLLLPEIAIGQDQEAARVFIVGDDDRVSSRRVELGPVVDGRQVVTAGIEPGERVVVRGLNMLQDGQPVQPRPVEQPPADQQPADGGQ